MRFKYFWEDYVKGFFQSHKVGFGTALFLLLAFFVFAQEIPAQEIDVDTAYSEFSNGMNPFNAEPLTFTNPFMEDNERSVYFGFNDDKDIGIRIEYNKTTYTVTLRHLNEEKAKQVYDYIKRYSDRIAFGCNEYFTSWGKTAIAK
jgi:hypothetical protein